MVLCDFVALYGFTLVFIWVHCKFSPQKKNKRNVNLANWNVILCDLGGFSSEYHFSYEHLDLGNLRTIKGQNLPNSKKNFRRLASKQSYLGSVWI